MAQENNEVLSALIVFDRIMPRLNITTRETIKRQRLTQIQESLVMILKLLKGKCSNTLITVPIAEVSELIDTLNSDPAFIETDDESKQIIINKLQSALSQLYLFAGQFYMVNEFTFSPTKAEVLQKVIDNCIAMGYYFGYDAKILAGKG